MGWNQLLKFSPNQFQSCRKIFTTFLFAASITPWQMEPTYTEEEKQHRIYVCIIIRIKLLITWLLDVKYREKRCNYRHDFVLLKLGRIVESIESIDI